MKTTIKPNIITTELELKEALDNEAIVIYIEDPMYSSIVDSAKKSNAGKIMNGGGLAALIMGLLVVSGPLGWVMLLGGAVAKTMGKSMDSLQDYSVQIDEIRRRVMLYRKTGKNKYKASKYEISHI